MRNSIASFLVPSMLGLSALMAQTKTPPPRLTFPAKNGNVTFDHSAHVKREKNNCAVCHPKLFPQSAKAPVGFRPPHKTEEDKKVSCGFCHRPAGAAFETKGNCVKCHVKAGAKKG